MDYELDFFTAPTSVSPLSIEGSFDSLISATACLSQLKGQLGRWDGVSPLPLPLSSLSPIVIFRLRNARSDTGPDSRASRHLSRGSLLISPVRGGMLFGTSTCSGSSRINVFTRTRYPRSTPLVRFNTRIGRRYPHHLTSLGPSTQTRRPLSQPFIPEFMRGSLLRSISTGLRTPTA